MSEEWTEDDDDNWSGFDDRSHRRPTDEMDGGYRSEGWTSEDDDEGNDDCGYFDSTSSCRSPTPLAFLPTDIDPSKLIYRVVPPTTISTKECWNSSTLPLHLLSPSHNRRIRHSGACAVLLCVNAASSMFKPLPPFAVVVDAFLGAGGIFALFVVMPHHLLVLDVLHHEPLCKPFLFNCNMMARAVFPLPMSVMPRALGTKCEQQPFAIVYHNDNTTSTHATRIEIRDLGRESTVDTAFFAFPDCPRLLDKFYFQPEATAACLVKSTFIRGDADCDPPLTLALLCREPHSSAHSVTTVDLTDSQRKQPKSGPPEKKKPKLEQSKIAVSQQPQPLFINSPEHVFPSPIPGQFLAQCGSNLRLLNATRASITCIREEELDYHEQLMGVFAIPDDSCVALYNRTEDEEDCMARVIHTINLVRANPFEPSLEFRFKHSDKIGFPPQLVQEFIGQLEPSGDYLSALGLLALFRGFHREEGFRSQIVFFQVTTSPPHVTEDSTMEIVGASKEFSGHMKSLHFITWKVHM